MLHNAADIGIAGLGKGVARGQFSAFKTTPEWLDLGGFEVGVGASMNIWVGKWTAALARSGVARILHESLGPGPLRWGAGTAAPGIPLWSRRTYPGRMVRWFIDVPGTYLAGCTGGFRSPLVHLAGIGDSVGPATVNRVAFATVALQIRFHRRRS